MAFKKYHFTLTAFAFSAFASACSVNNVTTETLSASNPLPTRKRLELLEQKRLREWGTPFKRSTFGIENEWDFAYDGEDTISDNVPNHLRWDSPIDDDWMFPQYGMKLNTPVRGIMTFDRLYNPGAWNKTANVWKRDEYLTPQTGFTIELRTQMLRTASPQNEYMAKDAFGITYFDDMCGLGVHLSYENIKLGTLDPLNKEYPWVNYHFATARDYNTYRLVKYPNSTDFYFYIGELPPLKGKCDTRVRARRDGSYPYNYPRILVGDNQNGDGSAKAPYMNAAFALDYLYYRRGAVPQKYTGARLERKLPPPLPSYSPGKATEFAGGYGYFSDPAAHANPQNSRFQKNGYFNQGNGYIELDGRTYSSNARIGYGVSPGLKTVPGLGENSFTIEARLKVLPTSSDDGFAIEVIDSLGLSAFTISKDKVRTLLGIQPFGMSNTHFMNTADGFHTYRLTRRCIKNGERNCMYTYLYVDDDPVPVVADQHIGGEVFEPGTSRLSFGGLAYSSRSYKTNPHVQIDYIRWNNVAYAPPWRE